jgi:hypothetical protein
LCAGRPRRSASCGDLPRVGLLNRFGAGPVTLAYLYWEPANAKDIGPCIVHAAELAEFSGRVADPRVRFVGMSYRALWDAWAASDQPSWLRDHAAALRERYDVVV